MWRKGNWHLPSGFDISFFPLFLIMCLFLHFRIRMCSLWSIGNTKFRKMNFIGVHNGETASSLKETLVFWTDLRILKTMWMLEVEPITLFIARQPLADGIQQKSRVVWIRNACHVFMHLNTGSPGSSAGKTEASWNVALREEVHQQGRLWDFIVSLHSFSLFTSFVWINSNL